MAGNNRTVALKNSDLEVYALGETHGYTFPKGGKLNEGRGNGFTASVSQGAPTRRDSQPYQLYAFEDFGGGFGQVSADSVMGGAGQGGQPNRFLGGECWSLKGGQLMPLPARNLISPNVTGPFPDEIEMPRGVLPFTNGVHLSGGVSKVFTSFIVQASMTLGRVFLLLKSDTPTASFGTAITILDTNTGLTSTYISAFGAVESTDFKFYVFTLDTGLGGMVAGHVLNVTITLNPAFTIGGFAGTLGLINDAAQPYMQACVPAGGNSSYRMWARNIYGVYQIKNGSTYVPIVVTSNGTTAAGYFNAGAVASGEFNFAANYLPVGAIVFDNKFYLGISTGAAFSTQMWSATAATAAGASTSNDPTFAMGPATEHNGNIYLVDANGMNRIVKWNGVFPASLTSVTNFNTIGKANTTGLNPINNLIIFQGNLWAFKPEGVFQIFGDPEKIVFTDTPRVIRRWKAGALEHIDNGKFVVEHQGAIFFNVRGRLHQLAIGQGGAPVVNVMQPPWPTGRYRTNPYITGITSDGQVLYVSYDNVGVQAWDGRGWHRVTDFYTAATVEGGRSGLTYFLNPGGSTDLLYVGDGRQLVKLAIPNILTSYSTQIYQEDQNKCMTFISSVVDMDLANVPKFFRSVALYGSSKGWNWKVVGGYYQTGDDPSYRTLIEKTFNEGLSRDKWGSPSTGIAAPPYKVITKLISGGVESATASPGIFVPADFQNAYQGSEKRASNDDVDNPVSAISMAFIVYGWRADGTVPAAGTYLDIAYIESIVLKYWATLEYLGTWQLTIDLQALYKTTDFKDPLSLAQAQADVQWLRGRLKAQTPTRWTFRWAGSEVPITIESPAYSPQWLGEGGTPISNTHWDVARTVSFRLVDTSGV